MKNHRNQRKTREDFESREIKFQRQKQTLHTGQLTRRLNFHTASMDLEITYEATFIGVIKNGFQMNSF